MGKDILGSLELNRIYHFNCAEGMKLFPKECIDLTVTSPPYDGLRKYNGYSFDFENVARELYRITKPGGVVVWVVNDATVNGSESLTSFRQALFFREIGFNVHDTMIYYRASTTFPETNRYYPSFEYMFIFSKGKPKTTNLLNDRPNKQAGNKISGTMREANGELRELSGVKKGREVKETGVRFNVWEIHSGYMKTTKDKFAYKHPAMFPESLAKDHILSWTNEGDIVLDPFMGAGTTAKMANLNKRKWIGFELSREYIEIANMRLDNLEEEKK